MDQFALNLRALDKLRPPVGKPAYDLRQVERGIVHIGVGGFHRAHMARLTHDLMQSDPDALSWGIAGAGLLPSDRTLHEALASQDGLYTLVERDQSDETVTVIGSVRELIYAGHGTEELLSAIDREQTRIVSLTVTGHGYCLGADKHLNLEHPQIVADLANPRQPCSAVGVIVEALRRRMVRGQSAFTALSCDNMQHNGRVLREAALTFANELDPALADWIAASARFPSTMVDRITPVTRPADVEDLTLRYGIIDKWPVFSETFIQWVIEDDFANGRPAWDKVGAQFVPDVTPYELMKLRLLNASHLAIASIGALLGYTYIDEAMRDHQLRRYVQALMDRETGPTLLAVPGINLPAYKATLIDRFSNPTIKDTVDRVNTDAPVNYLLDPIRDRLAANAPFDLLALALAAWLRRVRGTDERGAPIPVNHPMAELLTETAKSGGSDPRPLLNIWPVFGELGRNQDLIEHVGYWLSSLYQIGTAETLTVLT